MAWSTGLPDLTFQHVYLTQILDWSLSRTSLFRVLVSLSLETVMVGEVDELEEDVG